MCAAGAPASPLFRPDLDAEVRAGSARSAVVAAPSAPNGRGLEMLHGVIMDVTVELGRARMSVRELLALSPGTVLEDRLSGQTVTVDSSSNIQLTVDGFGAMILVPTTATASRAACPSATVRTSPVCRSRIGTARSSESSARWMSSAGSRPASLMAWVAPKDPHDHEVVDRPSTRWCGEHVKDPFAEAIRGRLVVRQRLPRTRGVAEAVHADVVDSLGGEAAVGGRQDLHVDIALAQAGDHLHQPGGDHVVRISRKRGDDIQDLHLSASRGPSNFNGL